MIEFDDSVTAANLPATQKYGIYYVDGRYANQAAVRARLPHATLAGITVAGKTGKGINFCDCETGDLTVAQAEAWVAEQVKLGVELLGVYANLSTWAAGLHAALAKYGDRIKRWCAAYDQDPALVLVYQGSTFSFDAHQWAGGVTSGVDKNVAADTFFTPYKAPVPHASGTATFKGSVDLATGKWTITGTKGLHRPVRFTGNPPVFAAQINVKDGKWSVEGIKAN